MYLLSSYCFSKPKTFKIKASEVSEDVIPKRINFREIQDVFDDFKEDLSSKNSTSESKAFESHEHYKNYQKSKDKK